MAKDSPPLERRFDIVHDIAMLLRDIPVGDQVAILRSVCALLGIDIDVS